MEPLAYAQTIVWQLVGVAWEALWLSPALLSIPSTLHSLHAAKPGSLH
jgi:hypothetical protein